MCLWDCEPSREQPELLLLLLSS